MFWGTPIAASWSIDAGDDYQWLRSGRVLLQKARDSSINWDIMDINCQGARAQCVTALGAIPMHEKGRGLIGWSACKAWPASWMEGLGILDEVALLAVRRKAIGKYSQVRLCIPLLPGSKS